MSRAGTLDPKRGQLVQDWKAKFESDSPSISTEPAPEVKMIQVWSMLKEMLQEKVPMRAPPGRFEKT